MARKQRTGVVQSDKMDKTVVVLVERTVTHPLYKKVLRRRKKYQAHDEANACALGDTVIIEECRPISKNKHWRVVEILERHEVAEIQPRDIAAPPIEEEEPEPAPAEASVAAAAETAEPEDEAPVAEPEATGGETERDEANAAAGDVDENGAPA